MGVFISATIDSPALETDVITDGAWAKLIELGVIPAGQRNPTTPPHLEVAA